jgi:hypothetical protein
MVTHNIYDRIYRKKDEIVARAIAGETILVPVMGSIADMQRIFALNPVGEFIWARLNGEKSLRQIGCEISEAFDVDGERALSEAEEFAGELLKEGLVEKAG